MKINFKDLSVTTLNGQPIIDLHKTVGNTLWVNTLDIDISKIAEKIYNGEEVEMTQVQKDKIIEIIESDKSGLVPFAVREIKNFINNVK